MDSAKDAAGQVFYAKRCENISGFRIFTVTLQSI